MRSRPVQVLLALVVSSGVVIAAGVILSTITKTQSVTATGIFLDKNCNGLDDGNEVFPSVALGQEVDFCLVVKNTATSPLDAHVHMMAACPVNGNASVSNGAAPADDLAGPDQRNACGVELAGPTKLIAGGGSASWKYVVLYLVAAGDYTWTFSAVQG